MEEPFDALPVRKQPLTEAQKQRKKQSKDMTRRKKLMNGQLTALVGNDPAARAICFSSTGRSTAWAFDYHGQAYALPDNTKLDLQALVKLIFSSYSKERLSGAMQLKQALQAGSCRTATSPPHIRPAVAPSDESCCRWYSIPFAIARLAAT